MEAVLNLAGLWSLSKNHDLSKTKPFTAKKIAL